MLSPLERRRGQDQKEVQGREGEQTISVGYEYSAYCTVFWFKEKGVYHVWMWNELTDKPLKKYQCKTKEEAEHLIDDYISHAPAGAICHNLMRSTQPRKEKIT